MSGFQVACLTGWMILSSSAAADQTSQLIAPAQQNLLIRSYRRCLNANPQHSPASARVNDAALLASAYPFDVDALSLLKNSDIERAPRERVRGVVYLRCGWFGLRR